MRPDELFSFLRPYGPTPGNLLQHELFLEFLFWLLTILITLALLVCRPKSIRHLERTWKHFARRRTASVVLTIFAALAVRVALLPILPIPDPIVHDEYSYLLQAETFALGRLTNPTPAMWVHFESFHINLRPTYQSMYPPAQALPMAAAIAAHVSPWWGVWLSVGLMCGVVCWMLQGWMPPHWALLGGMFCVMRFATFSYWIGSYFGGAVPAIGGALVYGALPRLKRSASVGNALWFALGLAILANSRPYEGFVFSLPAVASLLWWVISSRRHKSIRLATFAPALALLVLVVAGMAYYNWRSTGNLLLMPYQANMRQYHITKPFIWQERTSIPQYHHAVMRRMYVMHELPDYINRRYAEGLWNLLSFKFRFFYDFYIWPLLVLLIFACWIMLKSPRMRIFPVSFLLVWAGLLIEQWPPNAHYAAPFLGVVVGMVLYGLRLTRTWIPRGLPVGRMMVCAIVITFLGWTAAPLMATALNPYGLASYSPMPPVLDRTRLAAQLERLEGKHLILVRNRETAAGFFDCVYNEPDIDHAKIIWARDMDEKENQELIRYYPDRHVWIVDQDDGIMRLEPYRPKQDDLEPIRMQHVATNQPVAAGR